MKIIKKYLPLLMCWFLLSCNAQGKRTVKGETEFQRELNASFKDASTSPLTKKGLKKFNGLDFFPVDDKFTVKAKLIKTPDSPIFKFPTTTDRVVVYKKYGEVLFTIDGEDLKLAIYKDEQVVIGYENYLFLPFLDKTNGKTSYGGGRFIDVFTTDEQSDGTILIDFNKAYNPYCAYSDRYSCPITPRSNYVNIAIKAGVMKYAKNDK